MPERWMQEVAKRMERKGTKGEFTRKAESHGMGVQEFANHVLSHPGNFSAKTVDQAQFARTAGKIAKKRGD